tara:strand:+ start:4178 stop:5704 length:1527 start_codon:yes stop_codon:yes gene_type:complete
MSLLKDLGLENTFTKGLLSRQKSQRSKAMKGFGLLLFNEYFRNKNYIEAEKQAIDVLQSGTVEKAKAVAKFNRKSKIVNRYENLQAQADQKGIDLKELFRRNAQEKFIANELDGNRDLIPLNNKLIKDYSNAEGLRLYNNLMDSYNNFMEGPTTVEEYTQPIDNAIKNISRQLESEGKKGLRKNVGRIARKVAGYEEKPFNLEDFNKNIKSLAERERYQPITLDESETPIENVDYIDEANIHLKLIDLSPSVENAELLKELDLPFIESYTKKLQKEYAERGIRLTDTSALSEILDLDSVTLSTHISFNNAYEKNMSELRSLYKQEDGQRKVLEKAIEDRSLMPYVYQIATEEKDPVFQSLITDRLGDTPSDSKLKNYIATLQIINPDWYEKNFADDSVKQRMAALNIHSILSDISDLEMTEIQNIQIAAKMFEEAYTFEDSENLKYDHFTYQRTKIELGLGDFYMEETPDKTIEYYLNNIRKVYGPKSDKEKEFIEFTKNNIVNTYFK